MTKYPTQFKRLLKSDLCGLKTKIAVKMVDLGIK